MSEEKKAAPVPAAKQPDLVRIEVTSEHGHEHKGRLYRRGAVLEVEPHFAALIEQLKSGRRI